MLKIYRLNVATPPGIYVTRKRYRSSLQLILRKNGKRISFRDLVISIAMCSLLAVYILPVSAQRSQHVIHMTAGNIQDPIKILEFRVNGHPMHRGIPFDSDDNWIGTISVIVQNRSPKLLTCLQLGVDFPELADPANRVKRAFSVITAGRIPEHAMNAQAGQTDSQSNIPAVSIGPGQTVEVRLADSLDGIQRSLHRRARDPRPNQIVISLYQAYFSDDTKWLLGQFYRYNPDIQWNYEHISRDAFYQTNSK